jgi:hypothetical protein
VRFFVQLDLLERGELRVGEDPAVLRHFGLKGFEPVLHGRQIVPDPHAADARGRDPLPLLGELIRDPHLSPRGLIDRQGHHRRFEVTRNAIPEIRLPATNLLQRFFTTGVVQLLEPIETVPAIAPDLTGLGHVSELPGEF